MSSCGLIATASWDRSALLFDVASGASKALRTLAAHDGPLTLIAAARYLSKVSVQVLANVSLRGGVQEYASSHV